MNCFHLSSSPLFVLYSLEVGDSLRVAESDFVYHFFLHIQVYSDAT